MSDAKEADEMESVCKSVVRVTISHEGIVREYAAKIAWVSRDGETIVGFARSWDKRHAVAKAVREARGIARMNRRERKRNWQD